MISRRWYDFLKHVINEFINVGKKPMYESFEYTQFCRTIRNLQQWTMFLISFNEIACESARGAVKKSYRH